MRFPIRFLGACAAATVIASAGCADDAVPTALATPDTAAANSRSTTAVTRITVSPSMANIVAGTSVQLAATGTDRLGHVVTGLTFTRTTSSAAGSASGLVAGVGAGAATITASSSGVFGGATVTDTVPAPAPTPAPAGSRWVSGYYVGYQRAQYPETQIDFSTMTHIIVGAIQATSTGGVTTDFYIDNTNGPIMATNVSSRAYAAGRKAILMLGGDGNSATLRSAVSDPYRAAFVANLLKTMDYLAYDGIDVDSEPLATSDHAMILQFLNDLRAARPSILLTFPIGFVGYLSTPDAWYAQISAVVDQMNAMTYSMADNWGGWVSWHEAALYDEGSNRPTSISSTMNYYLKSGVPAAKLGIGIGAYGSCWQGVSDMRQTLSSTAHVTAGDDEMSYANIMSQYYTTAAYRRDTVAKASYLSYPTPKGPSACNFVSYEDPTAVAERGAYVKSAGLGGAIVWTIGEGHVATAPVGQQDPLVAAAYNSIIP